MHLATHWQRVYRDRDVTRVSWFQPRPALSLELLQRVTGPSEAVVDVGAGASTLADHLLAAGYSDLTLVDLSAEALGHVAARMGRPEAIRFEVADVRTWRPGRTFDAWHDRAVFHFLTEEADREAYRQTLLQTLEPGGHAVVLTFHPTGPDRCSDLPTARYDADGLFEALGGDTTFELLDARVEEHVKPDGRIQPFQGVLLRRKI